MTQEKYKKKAEDRVRVVGEQKNAHGTRFCQRIQCSRCHVVDYVPVLIKNAKTKYCRACAEKYLATYEVGRVQEQKQVSLKCPQCQKDFLANENVATKKENLLCKNCYQGFLVWRGKVSSDKPQNFTYSSSSKKSGSNTILRKQI